MKDLITIGIPSKGRLKDKAISFFDTNGTLKFHKAKKKEIILELLKINLILRLYFFMPKRLFSD